MVYVAFPTSLLFRSVSLNILSLGKKPKNVSLTNTNKLNAHVYEIVHLVLSSLIHCSFLSFIGVRYSMMRMLTAQSTATPQLNGTQRLRSFSVNRREHPALHAPV